MPATRSVGQNSRPVPIRHHGDPQDIIVVSSDSEDEPPHTRPRRKSPVKRPVNVEEVVELSSDDLPSFNNQKMRTLELKLRKMTQENEKLKQNQISLANQVADLMQSTTTQAKGLDPADLEDSLTCEICTLKLWSPFILPECGHTFCQNCLQDWFNTALAQHLAIHPHYNINRAPAIPPYMNDMLRFLPVNHQQKMQLAAILGQQQVPQPKYTCPVCREHVRNRPVEAFAVKNLVRVVAKAQGEESPQKPTAPAKGKSKGAVTGSGPWDKFFKPA